MRRSLYVSSAIHAAILLWVALGDGLFKDSPDPVFEVTGVTLVSTAEFDAMFDQAQSSAPEAEITPAPRPAEPEPPAAPEPLPEPAPLPEPPAQPAEAAPEPAPQPEPTPPGEVTDTLAPPAPPWVRPIFPRRVGPRRARPTASRPSQHPPRNKMWP